MPINNLIQFRKGTDWSSNPTLSSGEPGFDIANNVLKIGDGSTAWNALKEIGSFAELYSGDLDGAVVVECKNSTGATIPAGTPVYVSGYYSTNGKALISIAKANDSSKMPAIGLLESELANNTEGYVHCFGLANKLDSSSFSVGNTVYVHPTGGLTNIRPTGNSELVQNIGRVLRSDASQGRILILGPGRTNDVPNSGSFSILSIKDAFTFPTTDGNANQVLKTNGAGILSWADDAIAAGGGGGSVTTVKSTGVQVGGADIVTLDFSSDFSISESPDTEINIALANTYLQNVSEDSSPSLGADLDLNSYSITGIGGININNDISTSGNITADGSVGIGTASPQAKLDVNGTVQFDDLVRWEYPDKSLDTTTSTLGYMRLYDEAGAYCGLGVSTSSFNVGTSGAINLRFLTDAVERIIVESNGNTVINELGHPVNFRVEGDLDPYLFFVKGAGAADKVGVGASVLNGKFSVYYSTTDNSFQYGIHNSANHYTTTGGTNYVFGNYTDVRKHVASGVTDTGYVMGHECNALLSDEGSLASAFGLRTYAGINNQSDNGNLTVAYGIQSRVLNYSQGTGNINTARGIDIYINGDLGSVGNGGITNAYGVYIQSILNSTNTYGLYQVGSSDKNYFAGDVGIGTPSPSYKLDVNGTFSANSINVNDQFTFPTGDGSANQYLQTDGAGNLSWSSVDSAFREYEEVTTNKTTFTTSATYDSGNLDVYYNGLKLLIDEDYTANGGTTFELIENAVSGDIVEWVGGYTGSRFFQNVFGSGTANYTTKWVDKNTITSGIVYDDGTNVGIGTASPSYKLEVNGDIGLTDSGFYASPTGVMVGTSGWLYNDGQTTLSHGNFSNNGDAQNSSYVLRTSTTNDTFTTIQNNASNVILASNRTMMFTANIVARRTNGQDNAAYKIEGVLVNDGYGASMLGTPVKTILYESDSSWDVQAILSGGGAGASDYLLIQGKGAASKNVNWVCKLDLLEVGGDISGYTEANTLNIDPRLIP